MLRDIDSLREKIYLFSVSCYLVEGGADEGPGHSGGHLAAGGAGL